MTNQTRTIKIELPIWENMEKIIIRLKRPRIITYKDGRNIKKPIYTYRPSNLIQYDKRRGVYIICKDEKVIYVGSTGNILARLKVHPVLEKYKNITEIYFIEENDIRKSEMMEMIYKSYYFGDIKREWKFGNR